MIIQKVFSSISNVFSNELSGEVYINKKNGNKISGKVLSHLTNNYTGDLDSIEVIFLNLFPLGSEIIEKRRKKLCKQCRIRLDYIKMKKINSKE